MQYLHIILSLHMGIDLNLKKINIPRSNINFSSNLLLQDTDHVTSNVFYSISNRHITSLLICTKLNFSHLC